MRWISDLWLEYRIGMYYHLFLMGGDKRKHLRRMNELVRQRSARQIAKMERDKGLA